MGKGNAPAGVADDSTSREKLQSAADYGRIFTPARAVATASLSVASGDTREGAMAEKVEFGGDYEFPKEVHNMLAGAQNAHVQLSAMADSKASILMGATFVVFSLTIGEMGTDNISAPMLILGAFSFAAAVLSVMAVLPSISGKSKAGVPNPLFFGSFSRMNEEEFIDTLIGAMRSEEQVYRMMARDLYQNGFVLQRRKYRFLAYAYRTFLAGMIATVIAFIAQSIFG